MISPLRKSFLRGAKGFIVEAFDIPGHLTGNVANRVQYRRRPFRDNDGSLMGFSSIVAFEGDQELTERFSYLMSQFPESEIILAMISGWAEQRNVWVDVVFDIEAEDYALGVTDESGSRRDLIVELQMFVTAYLRNLQGGGGYQC